MRVGEAFEEIGDHWHDDAFDRKAYAEFLTKYLRGRVLGSGTSVAQKPFTMALDANWGSGKTFFIRRWSEDLRATGADKSGHTVVSFVAFMSELRSELQRAVAASGLGTQAKTKAQKALSKATKNIRQLALPAAGLALKGVVRKFSGVDIDEIADAIGVGTPSAAGSGGAPSGDQVKVKDVMPEKQVDEVLDHLFKAQLSEHGKRRDSIRDFKTELAVVLDTLSSREGYSAPLFVFVDELDRCKPIFAVGLLEAVKHIFDVPGVCVVIATNMEQLAHTIKAVYGQGFDARTYLQRFFDATYALPVASGPRLLEMWLKERPIFTDERCKWGIPGRGFRADAYGPGKSGMLAWIFDGLKLDLRAQGQVIELMEATALGVPDGRRIHVAWLALVCGLWHSHRSEFDALELKARMDNGGDEVWQRLGLDTVTRKAGGAGTFNRESQDQTVSVKDVGATYCAKANANLTVLREHLDYSSRSYSNAVMQEVLLDAPQSYQSGTHYPTGLFDYFHLVRTAGHFKLS
jgi:hypothetical protein